MMTEGDYVERLLREVEAELAPDGHTLSPGLLEGFRRYPRGQFVHRFRRREEHFVRDLDVGARQEHLDAVYSDTVLYYVDADGKDRSATNSRPSMVLAMATLLDIQPGHKVLEIGSGSGWLCAVMSGAVGPHGHVVGIEILRDLADQAKHDLADAGADRVTVVAGDGAKGYPLMAPFDRAIMTAGSPEFPTFLFEQTSRDAKVIVPISNRGLDEEVWVLERSGAGFHSTHSWLSRFVPLRGETHKVGRYDYLSELPLWAEVKGRETGRRRAWFGGRGPRDVIIRTKRFRSFMTKVEPGFRVFNVDPPGSRLAAGNFAFGVVDEDDRSMVVVHDDWLVSYGGDQATERFLAAYRTWCERMMPSGVGFMLSIYPRGHDIAEGPNQWVDLRGDSTFVWTLAGT